MREINFINGDKKKLVECSSFDYMKTIDEIKTSELVGKKVPKRKKKKEGLKKRSRKLKVNDSNIVDISEFSSSKNDSTDSLGD